VIKNNSHYKVVRKIDRLKWSQFVLNHPQGNFFQSQDAYDLFQMTKNYQPLFISGVDNKKKIHALLLAVIQKELKGFFGYFTSRTIVWGGPLINASHVENEGFLLELLLSELIKQVKFKSIYIQIRNLFDMGLYSEVFQNKKFDYNEHLNYQVDTINREITEKKISKSKMRQVKKSLKAGVKIIEPINLEQVREFFLVLKDLYKNKIRRPLPDWSFFETFYLMSQEKKTGVFLSISAPAFIS